MKVIFLDVDGVLNAGRCNNKQDQTFKLKNWVLPHPIQHLNRIAKVTGAKFVLSSTWRIGKLLPELREMFKEVGFEGELIGTTPNGPCSWHRDRGYLQCETGHRGAEIADWLRNHRAVYGNEQVVESFVIIDDSSDMGDLMDRLVHTCWYKGMVRRDADKVIRMLQL